MKKALITGITGQDGSYLAELLLSKGYEVHGVIRRSSSFNTGRIDDIYQDKHNQNVKLLLHYGDLTDSSSCISLLNKIRPDEIYNLAAQSHVKVSFEIPEFTGDVVGLGTLRLLEAMKQVSPESKFYQAGSSEMYGLVQQIPQSEKTPFYPRSPYAAAKVYAHWLAVNYREAYDLFVCNGILFNHESPRRGGTFVTKKITRAVAAIKLGLQKKLYLGNLEAKRDWGHARDYVEVMWKMLQHDIPSDYVVATGETHSVKEFVQLAFDYVNLDWKDYVEIDQRYFRPTEVDILIGDATKAKETLGWSPKVSFKELIYEMIDADTTSLRSKIEGYSKQRLETYLSSLPM